MHISINTEEPLSDIDRQVLAVLSGQTGVEPTAAIQAKAAELAERVAPAAKKAAAAAAPAAKPKPKPKPKPEPVVEDDDDVIEDDDDVIEDDDDEEEEENLRATAVELATTLVAGGKASKVKAVLDKIGAPKVGALDDDDLPAFIAALKKIK